MHIDIYVAHNGGESDIEYLRERRDATMPPAAPSPGIMSSFGYEFYIRFFIKPLPSFSARQIMKVWALRFIGKNVQSLRIISTPKLCTYRHAKVDILLCNEKEGGRKYYIWANNSLVNDLVSSSYKLICTRSLNLSIC